MAAHQPTLQLRLVARLQHMAVWRRRRQGITLLPHPAAIRTTQRPEASEEVEEEEVVVLEGTIKPRPHIRHREEISRRRPVRFRRRHRELGLMMARDMIRLHERG